MVKGYASSVMSSITYKSYQ